MSICNDPELRDRWQEAAAERERNSNAAAEHAPAPVVVSSCSGIIDRARLYCKDDTRLMGRLDDLEGYVLAVENELIRLRYWKENA